MRRFVRPTRVTLLLLASLLTLLPAQAVAAKPHRKHEVREEILALEQQWRTAQLNNDVSAMDKLLSDDYLGITSGGNVLTKAQQLDRMRSRALSLTSLEISDIKVKLVGQIAIVNSLAHTTGTSDDVRLDGSFRYTRIYQHLPSGAWKITNFEITRIREPRGAQPSSD
jgi:ketosteroid isomerase-like protein